MRAAVERLEHAAVPGAEDDDGSGRLEACGVDVVVEPRQTVVAALEARAAVEGLAIER